MTFSDEELMVMFSAGTTEAFDLLYERYRHRLYRFARSSLASLSAAEDALQEVFLRVARSASQYRPGYSFKAWVFQITANCIRDIGRTEIKMRINDPLDMDNTGSECNDAGFHERRIIAANELEQYLAALEPDERMLLMLKECEGLDVGTIADIAGASAGSIRVRLHRIRRKLVAGRDACRKER